MNETVTMIKELSDAFGASGFEEDVVALARKYTRDLDLSFKVDHMNNVIMQRPAKEGLPTVMLDAHSDEVSFMIQAIRENGTLDFLTLGGFDPKTLSASKVVVRTRTGKLVSGIISSKPVHFQTAEDRTSLPAVDKMVIDVGATSKKEAMEDYGIHVGDPAVPGVTLEEKPETGLLMGKAFDCRIGVAVVIEALKRLNGKPLTVNLTGTLTSQEEVGERGAQAAVAEVNPDLAIMIEGAPADDTFTPEYKIQTGIHRGPMVRHMDVSMIANPRLTGYVIDETQQTGIPLQEAVRRGGGTNGKVVHVAPGGVPSVVISVPVRYAHSSYCYIALDDFEKTVDLVCRILTDLDAETIGRFSI